MSNCYICKKKIPIVYQSLHTCRCKNLYCKIHLIDHNCEFDYKLTAKEQILKSMPQVVASKVIKI